MHFHWCGNFWHDLVSNTVALLTMAPDWVPLVRSWAQQHTHKHDDHKA